MPKLLKCSFSLIFSITLLSSVSFAQMDNVSPKNIISAWASIIAGLGKSTLDSINGNSKARKQKIEHHQKCLGIIIPELRVKVRSYCNSVNDSLAIKNNQKKYTKLIKDYRNNESSCHEVVKLTKDYFLAKIQINSYTKQRSSSIEFKPIGREHCQKITDYYFAILPSMPIEEMKSSISGSSN